MSKLNGQKSIWDRSRPDSWTSLLGYYIMINSKQKQLLNQSLDDQDKGKKGWAKVYQFLSLSTCSNSRLLSTMRLFPFAVRYLEKLIQIWLWSILQSIPGNIRRYRMFLSSAPTTYKYMLCTTKGATSIYFIQHNKFRINIYFYM